MRIGIVGLGIGGATAAAAMVVRGMDVTIFEQAPEIREVGAGVATWPNTIRLLNRMGIKDALATVGCSNLNYPIRDAAGTIIQPIVVQSYDETEGYYFHRAELLETITSLIPRDRVRLGSRCRSVAQDGDEVIVTLEDGRTEAFDVVIGADGIKSNVIQAVTDAAAPNYSNLAAYRGLVRNEGAARLEHGNMWNNREKYLVAFPVSGGSLINFAAVVPTPTQPDESWFMTGSKADLAAEFAGWDAKLTAILDAVDTTFRWGLYYRHALPHIVRGRVALLGDAGHPMLIHAGQGVGQAMEDGVALAVLLDNAKPDQVEERLRLYEALRLPRASAVQSLSYRNAQFSHAVVPVADGEERPPRAADLQWIFDYDVEREAEALLKTHAFA